MLFTLLLPSSYYFKGKNKPNSSTPNQTTVTMKNLLFLILTVFTLTSCDKDDNKSTNPIEKLPPATQTGANTFGCLLDGEIFKPGIYHNSYNCFYQYVNGYYYFNVSANNTSNNILKDIMVGTEKLAIAEGQTLNLYERVNGNAFGSLSNLDDNTGIYQHNSTSAINTGELKITKLDLKNNIVAGTFWYDIKDNKGVIHQIREGRFDMQFTK